MGLLIDLIVVRRTLKTVLDQTNLRKKKHSISIKKIKYLCLFPLIFLIFGIISFIIAFKINSGSFSITNEKILWSLGLAIGIPGLSSCVGLALLFREAIPNIFKKNLLFSNYVVLSYSLITSSIYVALLCLIQYRILSWEDNIISHKDVTFILISCGLFAILSALIIFKGYLSNRIKGQMIPFISPKKNRVSNNSHDTPYWKKKPVFCKKLFFGLLLELPIMISFFVIMGKMVFLGYL